MKGLLNFKILLFVFILAACNYPTKYQKKQELKTQDKNLGKEPVDSVVDSAATINIAKPDHTSSGDNSGIDTLK